MSSSLPLAGVKVLDLTRVLAGPYCTMLLADLGAEVVKIERPDGGDDARQFGPFLPSGESAYFASINRGKKSITLNLKHNADRELLVKLAMRADVLVENFRPGTMEHFGLSSERLRQLNPRLIYASATGFGRTGPDSRQPAYDVIVQARSGLMSITGYDEKAPARVGSSISDILAGVFTALGIVASLRQRDGAHDESAGNGADLDLSMLECTVATLENAIARFAVSGTPPGPIGTRHPSIAPFQAFRAADGLMVIAAGNDTLWRQLCETISAPELITDAKLTTNPQRAENVDYLEQRINARLTTRTVSEWVALLDAAGVPAAPIHKMDQVVADPQLGARGMWHTLKHDSDTLLTAGTPFTINGQKPALSHTWPKLGEHNESVRREWLGE